MGWDFGQNQTKKELIAYLTKDYTTAHGTHVVTITKRVVGNHLWVVHSTTGKENVAGRYIALYLMGTQNGDWGYKALQESSYPYYFDCPLELLDMVPVACTDWRTKVKAFQMEENKKKLNYQFIMEHAEIGDCIELAEGYKHRLFSVRGKSGRSILGYNGRTYKLTPKNLGDAVLTKKDSIK